MLLALALQSALAADKELYVYERLGAELNPLGLSNDLRFEARTSLPWTKKGNILTDGTEVGYGADLEVSPAYIRVGPRFSFAPLTLFDVTGEVRYVQFDGLYSAITGFPTPQAGYFSSDFRSAHRDLAVPNHGLDADLRPEVQVKFGPVFATDGWEIHYMVTPGNDGNAYYYEPYSDMMMKRSGDVMWDMDAIVGAFPWDPPDDARLLLVGAIFDDQETVVTKDKSASLGGIVAITPFVNPNIPTVAVLGKFYFWDNQQTKGSFWFQMALRWAWDFPIRGKTKT